MCADYDSVASNSNPTHEACDVSEVTFCISTGRDDTLPARTPDQPDCMDRMAIYCIDDFPDKSQLPTAGLCARTSTDTFSYTCTTTNNNAAGCYAYVSIVRIDHIGSMRRVRA